MLLHVLSISGQRASRVLLHPSEITLHARLTRLDVPLQYCETTTVRKEPNKPACQPPSQCPQPKQTGVSNAGTGHCFVFSYRSMSILFSVVFFEQIFLHLLCALYKRWNFAYWINEKSNLVIFFKRESCGLPNLFSAGACFNRHTSFQTFGRGLLLK